MSKYHLYFFQDNLLLGNERIDAVDDDAAIRLARDRGKGDAVEVWNANARVRIVAPAKAAHRARGR
jgi:hypothetical protein